MDKLAEIMAHKRQEVSAFSRPIFASDLEKLDASLPQPPSFSAALRRQNGIAVIAEIKRRSPSAGDIAADANASTQATTYASAGADALSVLTDEKYFGGSLDDIHLVSKALADAKTPLPLLRKDFFVHPVQVAEAREAGASAILIIVRALSDDEIKHLYESAHAARLDALFEIHDEADLERALRHDAKIIGVNNRDLAIFKTDLALSERLIPQIPKNVLRISESGIHSEAEAQRARLAGADAILVGEALMRAADPKELIDSFRKF